jgi:hypothetical protein
MSEKPDRQLSYQETARKAEKRKYGASSKLNRLSSAIVHLV